MFEGVMRSRCSGRRRSRYEAGRTAASGPASRRRRSSPADSAAIVRAAALRAVGVRVVSRNRLSDREQRHRHGAATYTSAVTATGAATTTTTSRRRREEPRIARAPRRAHRDARQRRRTRVPATRGSPASACATSSRRNESTTRCAFATTRLSRATQLVQRPRRLCRARRRPVRRGRFGVRACAGRDGRRGAVPMARHLRSARRRARAPLQVAALRRP